VEWWVILCITFTLLIGIFLSGAPVFIAFLILNIFGILFFFGDSGFGLFTNSFFETTTNSTLIAIPLYILMGEILFRSGAVDVLYRSLDSLIGRSKCRLYYLSISLGTVFGALSGSSMGVVAMLGKSILPGMLQRNADPRLSIGSVLSGASLAPIIPPSVLMIVIGGLANVSIAGMMAGAIIPGMLLALMFVGYIKLRVAFTPSLAPESQGSNLEVSLTEKLKAFAQLLPFTLIISVVIGSILAGIATPEESGAAGTFAALMVSAFYGRLNLGLLKDSAASAARISTMILVIMMSSKLFGQLLAYSGATTALVEVVVTLELNRWIMLALLMALPFFLCFFIDQIALMLVVIPIYSPLLQPLGLNPLWFWILFLVNINVGGITPPFGYTMFALKGAAPSLPMTQIFHAAWPFVFIFVLAILLMAVFPQIILFIPSSL
jgi:tripartite ATP-independent transporter DctM subunit